VQAGYLLAGGTDPDTDLTQNRFQFRPIFSGDGTWWSEVGGLTLGPGAVMAELSGTVYVLGSTQPSAFPALHPTVAPLQRFQPAGRGFASCDECPEPLSRAAMCGVTDEFDLLFVFGGETPGAPSTDILSYDPALDVWSEVRQSRSGPPRAGGMASYSRATRCIWLAGGDLSITSGVVERFDPRESVLQPVIRLPSAVAAPVTACLVAPSEATASIVVLPCDGSGSAHCYDIRGAKFRPGPVLRQPRRDSVLCCVSCGSRVVCLGGVLADGSAAMREETWDPAETDWVVGDELAEPVAGAQALVADVGGLLTRNVY
jgi:hypothetical protein